MAAEGLAPLPYQPVEPARTARPQRRLRLVLASVIAGVVLLGGGAVAAIAVLNGPKGEEAVRAYFDRLAAGDAAGALAYVLAPAEGSYADEPLLTDAMLADAAARPTALVVGEPRQFARRGGGLGETIAIAYTVGEREFQQDIVAVQAKSDEPFLLERPFLQLRIVDEDKGAYSINGVPVELTSMLAFPGVYTATRAGNVLFAEVTSDGPQRGAGELPAQVRFEFPLQLADGAQPVVQTAVNAYLDGCARSHSVSPTVVDPDGGVAVCPFGLTGNEINVNWSIGRYPDVTVSLDGETVRFSSTAKGVVRYDMPAGWQDDEFQFDVVGRVTAEGSTINVYTNYRG